MMVFAFGAGFGVRGLGRASFAATTDRSPSSAVVEGSGACIDPAAMQANANLVEQVTGWRLRAGKAEEASHESERAALARDKAAGSPLRTTRPEWQRLASAHQFRLRVPCDQWSGTPRFGVETLAGSAEYPGNSDGAGSRADAAGLDAVDRANLEIAYQRAFERTWSKMRGACEKSDAYREAVEGSTVESDRERMNACVQALADLRATTTIDDLEQVVSLLARGRTIDEARAPSERVLFALAESSAELEAAMTVSLGRAKTERALDAGAICVEDTFFQLRPEPEEPG